jgi:hypothetical protein
LHPDISLRFARCFSTAKNEELHNWRIAKKSYIVIPAKAGIYRQHEAWIPAFAGMTVR